MSVKSVGHGKYAVVHCHGKNKGKRIKSSRPTTKAKAERQHRAIQASKRRRKKR